VDNVTHTLAGLAVAHAALYLRAGRTSSVSSRPLQLATLSTSALANNAPDLDFLYSRITPGKLGYLLHHRGHTHTLLATVPLGLLALGCGVLLARLLGQRLSRSERWFLLGLALFGGLLHIGLDFLNNYGVHPFWPLDNRWFYGDAIFIIEPWLLIALAGICLGASTRTIARSLLALLIAGLLAIVWGQTGGPGALVPLPLAWLLTLSALLWLGWMRWATPAWRRWSGALALLVVLLAQLGTRQQARARVERALSEEAGFALSSLVSTPFPANPLCWSMLAVGEQSGEYIVRQVTVASLPTLLPVDACRWPSATTTAPLQPLRPPPGEPSSGLAWGREFRAPLARLRELARQDCVAHAFLRFARVPFWIAQDEHVRLIGDLRYDRSEENEFAELQLDRQAPCPRFEPPWQPPLPLLDG
jgi:inner membrane protein